MRGQLVQPVIGPVPPQHITDRLDEVAQLPHVGTFENNRRDAARLLLVEINRDILGPYRIRLSVSAALLLLYEATWDVQQASRNFNMQEAMGRLHIRFDRTRSLEQRPFARPSSHEVVDAATHHTQERQDERLALMLNITDRPDVASVVSHLQAHRWNLPAALNDWFRNGIPVVQPTRGRPQIRLNMDMTPRAVPAANSVRPPLNQDVTMFSAEPAEYTNAEDYQGPAAEGELRQLDHRQNGFFIQRDLRRPLQLGCEDSSRLSYEHTQHGKVKLKRFKEKCFVWAEFGGRKQPFKPAEGQSHKPSAERPVTFDFNDPAHLKIYNKCFCQNRHRITGVLEREQHQPWSVAERLRLLRHHQQAWDRLLRDNIPVPAGQKRRIKYTKERGNRWTADLNKRFKGTSEKRNHSRSRGAVNTQRTRMSECIGRFNVEPDQAWFDKETAKRRKLLANETAEERRKRLAKEAQEQKEWNEADKALNEKWDQEDAAEEEVKEADDEGPEDEKDEATDEAANKDMDEDADDEEEWEKLDDEDEIEDESKTEEEKRLEGKRKRSGIRRQPDVYDDTEFTKKGKGGGDDKGDGDGRGGVPIGAA